MWDERANFPEINNFHLCEPMSQEISTVPSPACFLFSFEQNDASLRYLGPIFVTRSILAGNNVTLTGKIAGEQTGIMAITDVR